MNDVQRENPNVPVAGDRSTPTSPPSRPRRNSFLRRNQSETLQEKHEIEETEVLEDEVLDEVADVQTWKDERKERSRTGGVGGAIVAALHRTRSRSMSRSRDKEESRIRFDQSKVRQEGVYAGGAAMTRKTSIVKKLKDKMTK